MNKIAKITRALKKYDNFLITSHINLEGDSIGSQLAVASLLKALGKKYIIFDNDPIPRQFEFLLCGEKVKTALSAKDKFRAMVVVDCPVIERTGKVASCAKKAEVVLNIDHHISNSQFGDIRWVEPDSSSCGEMIYHLFKGLRIPIDKKAALAMYVAIVTDTGYFSYENTTHMTHWITGELIKAGIKPLWVGRHLNEKKSPNDLRLLQETLKTLRLHYNGRVSTLYTSLGTLKKLGLSTSSTENFVNYGRMVNTAKIAVFFLERATKEVHVSFRSKGEVDVNKVASLFKGGGHPNASGCLIRGSIGQAMKTVLPRLKSFL
ncbi:MAG: bifunctional oligoribonuclease/PAP phosphatase NrnA [Candidatus Omnitrophica bacterium]|nr:bifunctional oligoribonuclease/PAP phosphatase NrnA [Candidatus Omnitrophota bacterium]